MIAIRQRPWDPVAFLEPLRERLVLREHDPAFEAELWNDLCSESDAAAFYAHAERKGSRYSLGFARLLEAWRLDEARHASGFLKLYSLCFDRDPEWIRSRLSQRTPNFAPLDWFFEDEFRLCILLAYDELATTLSYHQDRGFYEQLGGPLLREWIDRVKSDETLHFANLLALVRETHGHRVLEARGILGRILELDLGQTRYEGTFVLDHTGPPFTPAMLKKCARTLLNKLEKNPHAK